MPKVATAFVEVLADTDKLRPGIEKGVKGALPSSAPKVPIDADTKKIDGKVKGLKSSIANLALAGAGIAFFKGAFSEAQEAEKSAKQVEAAIKSTGGAANVSAADIDKLSTSLSNKVGVDDEVIASGAAVLLTFTKVRNEVGKGNDIFNQGVIAAENMSAALGTDLQGNILLVGKALQDPVAGMSQLQRAGVRLSESNKNLVKSLAASGDTLGAQKVIIKELGTEFGGAAESMATDADKAKVAFGNFEEAVGVALAPVLDDVAKALTGVAKAFTGLPGPVQQGIIGFAGVAGVVSKFGDTLAKVPSKIADVPKAFDSFRLGLSGLTESGAGATNKIGGLVNSLGGLAPVAIGFAGAAAGVAILFSGWEQQAAKAQAQTESLRKEAESAGESIEQTFVKKLADFFATGSGDLVGNDGAAANVSRWMKDAGISAADLGRGLTGTTADFKAFREQVGKAGLDATKSSTGYQAAVQVVDDLRGRYKGAQSDSKALSSALKVLGIETEKSASSSKHAAGVAHEHATELGKLADEAKKAGDRIKEFYDKTTSGLSAQIQAEAAVDALSQSFKDNGRSLDITTEKGRNNESALIALKDAAVANALAVRDQTGSSDQAAASLQGYADKLRESAREAGFTDAEIELMIAQMHLTPDEINTTVKSNATAQETAFKNYVEQQKKVKPTIDTRVNLFGVSEAEAALKQLARDRTTHVLIALGQSGPSAPGHLNERNHARGGTVSGGQSVIVGDGGREELFVAPAGGGRILSSTAGATTGGTGAGLNISGEIRLKLDGKDLVGIIDLDEFAKVNRRREGALN